MQSVKKRTGITNQKKNYIQDYRNAFSIKRELYINVTSNNQKKKFKNKTNNQGEENKKKDIKKFYHLPSIFHTTLTHPHSSLA